MATRQEEVLVADMNSFIMVFLTIFLLMQSEAGLPSSRFGLFKVNSRTDRNQPEFFYIDSKDPDGPRYCKCQVLLFLITIFVKTIFLLRLCLSSLHIRIDNDAFHSHQKSMFGSRQGTPKKLWHCSSIHPKCFGMKPLVWQVWHRSLEQVNLVFQYFGQWYWNKLCLQSR